jgi:hypothetical protein
MRISALIVLLGFAGTAAAGDLAEPRSYEANDYSAQVYYRLDFGGHGPRTQSLGLRFDNERAAAAGAPALLAARFGAQGMDQLKLNGVDLRGAMLSSNAKEGAGFWASLSVPQWIAIGFTALVFGSVASDAVDNQQPPDGGGSGSGGT